MLGWGSWANTQKLAGKDRWPFELFYWDYAIGVFAFSLLFAFTLGSAGSAGMPFLENLRGAPSERDLDRDLERRPVQHFEYSAGGCHRRRGHGGRISGRRRPRAGDRNREELRSCAQRQARTC